MAKQIDIDKLHEGPPEVVTKINDEIINRRIDALNVKTEVRSLIGKEKSDSAASIKSLAESSNEKIRALFINMPEVEHAGEKYTLKLKEKPKDDEKKSEPKKDEDDKKKDEKKAGGWPKTKKTVDAVAATAAASIPVVFEGARNFILNIPLLGEALKGAATLGEPLAKALQLPALQSGITSGITAGAESLKGIYGLGWLGKILAPLTPAAPYILPTALTGGGLYALGKISDKLHNLAGKKTEKAGLFKTMWRGLITPVTLPWLAVTKAPTLVKKGYDVTKKVTAPLLRHKIGTYGGAFLGYSVLAGLTGGMAIPWAIAGGLGGRFIQKRFFSGKAAAPKLEAASEH